jgi:hypothetical protein
MFGRGIPLVTGEPVVRIEPVGSDHETITRDFGNHAGSRDGEAFAIAFDDGGLWDGKRFNGQAVNQRVHRLDAQAQQRAAHGQMGGAQDIEGINLSWTHLGYAEDNPGIRNQLGVNLVTSLLSEFFTVIEGSAPVTLGQDNGSGDHGPGQGTPAGLIDPGGRVMPLPAELVFESQ